MGTPLASMHVKWFVPGRMVCIACPSILTIVASLNLGRCRLEKAIFVGSVHPL
jgi:hypothetical protein